jgi:RecB family exonuclease
MDIDGLLDHIAAERSRDPLAPVTVIAPSRVAALQLRRRLAARAPYAGVRFEALARIAELIAAGDLARSGRRPLARPIADYVAEQAARESTGALSRVSDLQGYAVALRQTFRRLRRAGFHDGSEISIGTESGQLAEIARLYGLFRERTAPFYDEEDLLEAAADTLSRSAGAFLPELGEVWAIPPARTTAAAAVLLDALQAVVPAYMEIDEPEGKPEQRFILAPDAASEARLVARGVLGALDEGIGLHETAVFWSGDRSYRALLAQAFEAAGVRVASMPGTPLIELATGRAVLALARLPEEEYSRAAVFDFLGLAPLRREVPGRDASVSVRAGQWQRIAREAGVTHGLERWQASIELFVADHEEALRPESEISEPRRRLYEDDLASAAELSAFVDALIARLEPLRRRQPASSFIAAFQSIVDEYLRRDADGLDEIKSEIDQLGTIDAVAGEFDIASFTTALEANLRLAARREQSLGDGVLLADYRVAAGLSFKRVFICGAYEGAFPALTGSEPLLQDEVWSELRKTHPFTDDLARRLELANAAARRLVAVADGGVLTWSSPLQAANGTREYYPSALMTSAARERDTSIMAASDLRRAPAREWLVRTPSPLASLLVGPAVDAWERRLRSTVRTRRGDVPQRLDSPFLPAVTLLRARRRNVFSEYDGNLIGLDTHALQAPGASVSPTALEAYATCGFRYFLGSVLRLRGVQEPDESDTIGAAERGTLVHRTLERFFREQKAVGRPAVRERWTPVDLSRLHAIFEEELARLRQQGRTGLDVYMEYDRELMRADLVNFLEYDNAFRELTGAVPSDFELRLSQPLGELQLTGYVDRIDRTPDGRSAYVIDYKTGSTRDYERLATDPLGGGTKLQLPVYTLAAAGAEEVQALYWFISRRGGFAQISYDDNPENRARFEETVTAVLEGIGRGAFPAVPGEEDEFRGGYNNCLYCDFDRICSRRRLVEWQEKSGDAALQPWSRVAGVARGEQ